MDFLNATLAILRKDLLLEFRGKESLSLMLFLSLLLLVVFNFALDINSNNVVQLAPGILWVIFSFSGILGMGRTSMAEREDAAYLSIVLSPAAVESFYLGKMLSNFIFLLVMELATIFFSAILFDFEEIFVLLPTLLLPLVLATIGFAIIGTLFSFLSTSSSYGEVLLPFLYLPVVIPVILGGVCTTAVVLAGRPLADAANWLQITGAFDILYFGAALLLFQHLFEE